MVDKAVQVVIGSERPRQTSPAFATIPKIQKRSMQLNAEYLKQEAMAVTTNTRSGVMMTW